MKQNLYALVLAPAFKMLVNSSQKYKPLRYLLFINFFTLLLMMTAGNIKADTVKKFEEFGIKREPVPNKSGKGSSIKLTFNGQAYRLSQLSEVISLALHGSINFPAWNHETLGSTFFA